MTTVTQDTGRSLLDRVKGSDDVRRTLSFTAVALVVAVMTGPSGTGNEPLRGVKGSIFAPRVFVFLLAGLAVSAASAAWQRYGGAVSEVRSSAPVRRVQALRRSRSVLWGLAAVLLAVALVYPATLSPFWQRVLVDRIGVFVLLALGLNVVVGLAGLLDLGYIAFFAIGAYTTSYFTGALPVQPPVELNPFIVIPLAIGAAMIAGVLLGAPTLRLRGDYLAIVTLGFGEIVRIVAVNSDPITNGPRGAFGIPHFSAFGYQWKLNSLPYYYLLLAFGVLIVVGFRRLEDSRVGRAWTAIREDEVAAAACGVRTVRYKLLAFSIGASTAGFAGVFYASKVGFVNPDNFPLLLSILVLVYVIFGGMGSLWGVIVGAAALSWLPEVLRGRVPPEDRFVYFGALVIIMMIYRPQGLIPSRRREREIKSSAGADALGDPGMSGTTAGSRA